MKPSTGAAVRLHRNAVRDRPESLSAFTWNACPPSRRETVEHPFGTLKMRMGETHFLMKTLRKVATEMALHVLAYNLTRVMNIVGVRPLLAAIQGASQQI
jgi:DDE family transposase